MIRRSLAVAVALGLVACSYETGDDDVVAPRPPTDAVSSAVPTTTATTIAETGFGRPWGDGLLTFRGNPTRTFYGRGPVPADPAEVWSFPDRAMCSDSAVGGETTTWCGTGWTGQPAVFELDGRTAVAFGAYDRAVHVLDAETGERLRPDLVTGDLIKGSVTIDPDGFPLLYVGSRDNLLRVVALDRPELEVLWSLAATDVSPTKWNNDWDGAPLVVDDHLIEGGENSVLHLVRLGRAYGPDGLVTVDPELVFHAPGWDDELLAALPDGNVSIENSVMLLGDDVWFANSGGLVQAWRVGPFLRGETLPSGEAVVPERVFRFWMGDDVDASLVATPDGDVIVAAEWERSLPRAREVGQLVRLDPDRPDDPVVWSFDDQDADVAGFWATPAIAAVGHGDGVVIVPDHQGDVRGLDLATGELLWEFRLPGPTWSSPVIVESVWIQGDCAGDLHGYDVSDPFVEPTELWSVPLGACIESTPAVWEGRIHIGTRGGFFHTLE